MRVQIRLKRPLPENFKKEWAGLVRDFMVPGWLTWADNPHQIQDVKDGQRYSVHPEHNKWYINFPAYFFEIVEPLNLDEVLKL